MYKKLDTHPSILIHGVTMLAVQSLLIVEDDVSCRSMLKTYLGALCDAQVAATLSDARKLLGLHQFELILLDRGLPDGNGLSLISDIRMSQENALVVILTGDDDFNAVSKCISAGADDYVVKSEHLVPDLMIRIPVLKKRAELLREAATPQNLLPKSPDQISKESFQNALSWIEKLYLQTALELCSNNMSELADRLGFARTTVFNKINELQIDRPRLRRTSTTPKQGDHDSEA